jgi:hypothetical protein
LVFTDGTYKDFKSYPGLFARSNSKNKKIAVVGGYLPFCRIFGANLTYCSNFRDSQADKVQTAHDEKYRSKESNSISKYLDFIKWNSLESLKYFPLWDRLFVRRRSGSDLENSSSNPKYASYEEQVKVSVKRSASVSSHPGFDLVFIHLPFPHSPFIYNHESKSFNGNGSYRSNLSLMDRTLGEIRQSMKKAGLWDDSIIIISSDHSRRPPLNEMKKLDFRKYVSRIPFMVKMKNQSESAQFDDPINTVITSDMILGIFENKIETPEDLIKYMKTIKSN